MDDELCQAIDEVGMTLEQLLEVIERIRRIREDGGWGKVEVLVREGNVYQVHHSVMGKPTVWKKGEG